MADIIMIKPSSGDQSASLFSGPDSSESILTSLPTGTMLKVTGTSGNYYMVDYDNGEENITKGGTGMTGTIVAYPYAVMYDDSLKSNKLANINNGTGCEIIDDSNPSSISIKAVTTEGTLTGFVDAKYIYRDKEETPVMFKMTRTADKKSETKGTVTADIGLKARTEPSLSGKYVGAFNYNASLTIHETKNGWHRVTGTSGWGDLSDVWVNATYVKVDGSNSKAAVSKSDSEKVVKSDERKAYDDALESAKDYFKINNSADKMTKNDEYYRKLAEKYSTALGAPPRYNMDIDIQYTNDITAGMGRVMAKTVMSNPSILSICPGKVKMFPNIIGSKRDAIYDSIYASLEGGDNQGLFDKVKAEEPAKFSGKLYDFKADTAEYAKYLNALCRASAILLGIGDKVMPGTTTKLRNFDYSYWTVRKAYDPDKAIENDGKDSSIFTKFLDGMINPIKRISSVATNATAYINFFLNGSETQVSEQITNSITDGPLASALGASGTISSAANMLNYFSGSGFDIGDDKNVKDAMDAVIADSGSTLGGLKAIGENLLNGGKMVLPKMVEGATYGKTVSCNMKFMSPYGDKYSVFLKCIVPICHLLALALPKQLSDNMYGYPFLIKCCQIGNFNIDLGIIQSLTITRGGNDETSYTTDMIATEWDVQLEIAPLVDQLMMTPTTHPVLMVKNTGLLEYMSNFCGFDPYVFNADTQMEIWWAFVNNIVPDFSHSIEHRISDKVFNVVDKYFTI